MPCYSAQDRLGWPSSPAVLVVMGAIFSAWLSDRPIFQQIYIFKLKMTKLWGCDLYSGATYSLLQIIVWCDL